MSERDDERLSAFLDGALEPGEAERLRAELRRSAPLRARLEALRGVDAALRALPERPLPADLRARLDARLDARLAAARAPGDEATAAPGAPAARGGAPRRPRRARRLAVLAAAAAAAALLALWLRAGAPPQEGPPVARRPEPPPAVPGPGEGRSSSGPPAAELAGPSEAAPRQETGTPGGPDAPAAETLASLEEDLERPEDLAVIEMMDWLEALGEIDGGGRG